MKKKIQTSVFQFLSLTGIQIGLRADGRERRAACGRAYQDHCDTVWGVNLDVNELGDGGPSAMRFSRGDMCNIFLVRQHLQAG
jgi:hypothetical protein